MKRITILILLTVLCFIGCADTFKRVFTSTNFHCLHKVRKSYPGAVTVPYRNYQYLYLDKQNRVHYLEVDTFCEKGVIKDTIILTPKGRHI